MSTARFFAFIFCLALLLARAWDRLAFAHLWAEDGAIFLPDAFRMSYASLLKPYAGYFHLVPRAMSLIAAGFLPLRFIPAFIAGFCFVIFAAMASALAKEDYAWLIPSRAARVLTALMICLMPGLGEILGNLANIHIVFFLWLALLALKQERARISNGELCLAFVAILTEGSALLLAPLFLLRAWPNPRAHKRDLLIVGAIAASAFLNFAVRLPNPQGHAYTFEQLLQATLAVFGGMHLIYPIGGFRAYENLMKYGYPYLFLGCTAGFAALAWVLLKKSLDANQRRVFLLFEAVIFLQVILTWIARPGSIYYFYSGGAGLWAHRYTFLRVASGALLWMVAIRPQTRRSRAIAFGFAVWIAIFSRHCFHIPAYGYDRDWKKDAAQIESELARGCSGEVVSPIYPATWDFRYPCRR